VREHASNNPPEHSRWGSEVLEVASWVRVTRLVQGSSFEAFLYATFCFKFGHFISLISGLDL
jgi:hypothetical protein